MAYNLIAKMTMRSSIAAVLSRYGDHVLLFAVLASAAALIGAHVSERFGGLAPCPLCLDQREVHWTAIIVAAGGWLASRVVKSSLAQVASLSVGAMIYAAGAALAGYHAGVEYGFWPGPPQCASTAGPLPTGADIAAALSPGASQAYPSCEEAMWRFAGVSMAGYNALLSAGLFALLAWGAALKRGGRPVGRNI